MLLHHEEHKPKGMSPGNGGKGGCSLEGRRDVSR